MLQPPMSATVQKERVTSVTKKRSCPAALTFKPLVFEHFESHKSFTLRAILGPASLAQPEAGFHVRGLNGRALSSKL